MFKKLAVAAIATISLASLSQASALDLNALGNSTGDATATSTPATTPAATPASATSPVVSTAPVLAPSDIPADIKIVWGNTSIPADGKSTTTVQAKIYGTKDTAKSNPLGLNSVSSLTASVPSTTGDAGSFSAFTFDQNDSTWKGTYTAGTTAGSNISVKIVAKPVSGSEYVQINSDLSLVAAPAIAATTSVAPVTTPVEAAPVIATSAPVATPVVTAAQPAPVQNTADLTKKEANIVKTEVIGANRIKISFDTEVKLPDTNAIKSITVKDSKAGTELTISNIVVSDDKKSVIVSTEKNLEKVPYHVIVNEILSNATAKKISLVNATATVSGAGDLLAYAIALLAVGAGLFYRRKSLVK